jgi:hypothetical protein
MCQMALLAIYMKIPSGHDRPVSGVNGGATEQAHQVASEGSGKVSGRKSGEGRSHGQQLRAGPTCPSPGRREGARWPHE